MGFLDSVTAMNFKKDTEGKTLYYPWVYFGSGYIIESQSKANHIRKFHKKTLIIVFVYLLISCFTIVALSFYLDFSSSVQALKHIKFWTKFLGFLHFGFLFAYIAWFYFTIKKFTKGLEKTKDKLKIFEVCKKLYESSSLTEMICLELFCLAGVGAGIWLLQTDEAVFIDSILLGIYGFFAIALGCMIFLKVNNK